MPPLGMSGRAAAASPGRHPAPWGGAGSPSSFGRQTAGIEPLSSSISCVKSLYSRMDMPPGGLAVCATTTVLARAWHSCVHRRPRRRDVTTWWSAMQKACCLQGLLAALVRTPARRCLRRVDRLAQRARLARGASRLAARPPWGSGKARLVLHACIRCLWHTHVDGYLGPDRR